jgi:hypothetical protein
MANVLGMNEMKSSGATPAPACDEGDYEVTRDQN